MGLRTHIRLLAVLLAGLAGASVLVVGFGLTPLSGSVFGCWLGLGSNGDFSFKSTSPITITEGGRGIIAVTVTSTNHLSGNVTVSATLATSASKPPAVSTNESSVKLNPNASTSFLVVVSTTTSTTLGNYTITVQGKIGSVCHSIIVSADVSGEALAWDSYSLASSTNLTVYIRDTGTVSVQLVSYSVKDLAGDYYYWNSYPGPTIAVGQVIPIDVTINTSCPSCSLSGNSFTFIYGYSYTISFTSSQGRVFPFSINL
jgi:hypothetical protein